MNGGKKGRIKSKCDIPIMKCHNEAQYLYNQYALI